MGVTDGGSESDEASTPSTPAPARPATRSAQRHPGMLLLIFLGGAFGTWCRAVLESAAPAAPGGVPWTTLAINVGGSFLLGALLEALVRTGTDTGWRRGTRLALGTGVLGGFTTYSTFAVETAQRLTPATLLLGVGYALASVVLGMGAAATGYALARRAGRARMRQESRP